MSEPLRHAPFGATANGHAPGADMAGTAEHRLWRKVWLGLRILQARLRFVLILAAVGGTLVYWDRLKAHYEKWTRPPAAEAAAGADTEYWCPMHPTIVRDHPDKCPICSMPLSRRTKGEAGGEQLPDGVLSRVQFTPYRVAIAGIRTAAIDYQPLTRDVVTVGFVEFDERKLARITSRATGKSRIDKLFVNVTGQTVEKGEPLALLYSPDLLVTVQNLLDARAGGNRDLQRMSRDRLRLWGIDDEQVDNVLRTGKPITHLTIRSPIGGHVIRKYPFEGEYVEEGTRLYDVADLSRVWIEAQVYEDELAFLREDLPVSATTKSFPNRVFRGKLSFIHPHLDAGTRTLRVRFDMDNPHHALRPGMYATVTLQAPAARLDSLLSKRMNEWREQTAAETALHGLVAPTGPLGSAGVRALTQAAADQVVAGKDLALAVPERAVIDTGSRKIVYREVEPGVFDGVEVELGPRCGGFYPVLRGLQAGDRVATSGSFLIDAETRLTAGTSSTYFGASGGPQADRRTAATARPSTTRDDEDNVRAVLARLNPDDRRLVEAQGYCPILSDNRLGAMGLPLKLLLKGKPVFLCCRGCVSKARADEQATLDKVAALQARAAVPAQAARPARDEEVKAKVQANLARLSPEDRRLAEQQKYCPIQEALLGKMGKPAKVMIKGRPVFLCCGGCEDEALEHPEQTLRKVDSLRERNK